MNLYIPEHVLSRVVDGEVVLLNLTTESYFGLDAVGAEFWQALEFNPDFDAAVSTVCEQFEVSTSDATADLTELVDSLLSEGLLSKDR